MSPRNALSITLSSLETLVREGLLAADRLAAARAELHAESAEEPRGLVDRLLREGHLTEAQFASALAAELGVGCVFPEPDDLDWDLIENFPLRLLSEAGAVPVSQDEVQVVVAFAFAPEAHALEELRVHSPGPLKLAVTTRSHLEQTLELAISAVGNSTTQVVSVPSRPSCLEQYLHAALEAQANELRFDPTLGELLVQIRTDDGLQTLARAKLEVWNEIRHHFRPYMEFGAGRLRPAISTTVEGQDVRLRVQVISGDPRGPSICLRFSEAQAARTIAFDPGLSIALDHCLGERSGLVICSAPERERSRKLAHALTHRLDCNRRLVVVVDDRPADFPETVRLVEHTEKAKVMDPDAAIFASGLEGPEVAGSIALASRTLVIAAAADPSPATALLGFLERGARPSLLAYNFLACLGYERGRLKLLRLTSEQRLLLAADRRKRLVTQLFALGDRE